MDAKVYKGKNVNIVIGSMAQSKIKKPVIPLGTFNYGRKTLELLLEFGKLNRGELIEKIELGPSVVANNLPILKELKLIEYFGYRDSNIALTDYGKDFIYSLQGFENKKLKKDVFNDFVLNHILINSKALTEAYIILRGQNNITFNKLGHRIAEASGKKWVHEASYTHVGRSSVDYLRGFVLINGLKGTVMRKRKRQGFRPSLGVNSIVNKIKTYSTNRSYPIYSNYDKVGVKSRRLSDANLLSDLNLIRRTDGLNYKLTSLGLKLKKAIDTPDESRVFREIILRNGDVSRVFDNIRNFNGKFGWKDIGEILEEYNDAQWGNVTLRVYGTKFLSWLKLAGLVEENHERGKYIISFKEPIQGKIPVEIGEEHKAPIKQEKTKAITSPNGDFLTNLSIFSQHLNRILIELDNWNQDTVLEKDMLSTLEKMSKFGLDDFRLQIIIDQITFLVEKGFEDNDLNCIRSTAKSINKLLNEHKHIVLTTG